MPNDGVPTSQLRSRFGRRLLFLFVVCSLLPTIAVALLSYGTVTRQLRQASFDRLEHTAGLAGRGIMERLALIDGDLKAMPARSAPCPPNGAVTEIAACNGSLEYGISALAFAPSKGPPVPLFGSIGTMPTLGASEREALARGLGIVVGRVVDGHRAVYLLHAVDAPEGLLAAEVHQPYLWGDAEADLLPSMTSYVVDESGAVIAGSKSGTEIIPARARSAISRTATGNFAWSPRDGSSFAGYRAVPARDSIFLPRWTVVVSESRAAVVAPLADFSKTFPIVALIGLGVAVALGFFQLDRSLVPLKALHAGTKRLAARRFDHQVAVTSNDEFADVAASFNAMANEIRRQFAALAAAAEMDRNLLAAGTVEAIVRTALERMGVVGGAERVAITLIDPDSADGATTYARDDATGEVLAAWTARDAAPVLDHLALGKPELAISAAEAPPYLTPLAGTGSESLLVFPLIYQDRLIGALALAGIPPAGRTEEGLLQARRAAGQVAMAVANARMVERIRLLAFYDSLTGLPNRVSFRRRLTEELEHHRLDGALLAVFFLDLDHFSRINDTLGHKFGDRLVQEVGHRIKACCAADAPTAEVARLGGDEFTVILPRLCAPAAATSLAQSILESFGTPFALDGHEVFVSASIGVSINLDENGSELETIIKNADAAMYQAKQRGRNRFEVYAPAMGKTAARRLSLENHLRRAIDSRQFVLWYQPIIDLDTGAVASGEALIRWQHPDWGLVGPGEFIGLAEESGLIVPLGEWILESVCAQSLAWQRQGLRAVPIAVNISGQQLRGDAIVKAVQRALEATNLDPSLLELELTESILMQGEGEASAVLQTLAGLGIRLAIDDFGIGYSSLSYLKQFPVSSLKIDQSFVRDVTTNPNDAAITSAIIAMASALGLTVVAEGVETDEQVRFLRHHRCARIQGYLVGRPVAAHAFEAYLQPDNRIVLPASPSGIPRSLRHGRRAPGVAAVEP